MLFPPHQKWSKIFDKIHLEGRSCSCSYTFSGEMIHFLPNILSNCACVCGFCEQRRRILGIRENGAHEYILHIIFSPATTRLTYVFRQRNMFKRVIFLHTQNPRAASRAWKRVAMCNLFLRFLWHSRRTHTACI